MHFLVAVAILSGAGKSQTQTFASDKRLDAPITMRVKTESLSDFTADLTKLTKVHFSVTAAMADRKITAIFKDRPTKELLQAVTNTMFMDWKRDGNGYLLAMSRDEQRNEEAAIQADQDAIRAGLIAGLRKYAEAASMSDADKQKKAKDLQDQIRELKATANPDNALIADKQEDRRVLLDPNGQTMASLFVADSDSVVDRLLSGQTVCASTRSTDGCPALPPDYLDKLNERMSRGSTPNPRPPAAAALLLMDYNPVEEAITGETVTSTGQDRHGNDMSFFMNYQVKLEGLGSDKTKLGQRLLAWPSEAESAVMSKKIEVPPPPAKQPTDDSAKEVVSGQVGRFERPPVYRLTLADHLEYLADHAGVPVVGDAFRIYASAGNFGVETTVGDYVSELSKPDPASFGLSKGSAFAINAKSGWLLVRHSKYWRRLDREIPESLLRPLEQANKEKGLPLVEDYGKLASAITRLQALPIVTNPRALAVEFDTFPFQPAYNSLRLIGTLSDSQVAALEAGGLRLASLTPDQRRMFTEGLSASMWRGSLPMPMWTAALSPKGLDLDDVTMKIQVTDFPQGSNGAPVPRTSLQQEQAYISYENKSGRLFTEMYLVNKNYRR